MTIHKLRTALATLVFLAALAAGGGYLGVGRWPWATSPAQRPPLVPGLAAADENRRPRAGCSSWAACSIPTASRSRARR